MKCACGNAARYITSEGALTCALCPQEAKVDSIRISDVPKLLAWARTYSERSWLKDSHRSELLEILGKDLSK